MSMTPHLSRGDVVLVDYPFSSGTGNKRRPAVVVLNDRDNQRLTNTIVAMISSNTTRLHGPTQFLIDPSTTEGQLSGLLQNSAIICTALFTIEQRLVVRRIGNLSSEMVSKLDAALRAALAIE